MRGRDQSQDRRARWLWIALAAPGAAWLLVLFVVPFYAMVAVAGGRVNAFLETAVPIWDPLKWSSANLTAVWGDIFGREAFIGGPALRTVLYTAAASALSLAIAYPVAYFVARYGGRRKPLFLVALVAPFWVSYMMRMLAWIDLLGQGGFVNKALSFVGLPGDTDWLSGKWITVVLGLVYGYIPYLIVVLYAGLDRINPNLLEAGRDLGLGRWRTFWRVTVPLSWSTIMTGALITVLPMLGDYYTNQLLSGAPGTTMIGNVVESQLGTPGETGQGAVLALMILIVLLPPVIWYMVSVARTSREHA